VSLQIRHGIAFGLVAWRRSHCVCLRRPITVARLRRLSQPRPFRWSLNYMDTNGDGDVNGPDEGIEIHVRKRAVRMDRRRMEVLDEAFAVCGERAHVGSWAFRFSPPVEGPLEINEEGIDFINYIAIQDPNGTGEFEAPLRPACWALR